MTANQIIVKMVMDRWYSLIKICDATFSSLTDEDLLKEISPGKNRGIYLLGHLIAVHDDMLQLLNFGKKQHADLYEIFLKSPDKAVAEIPSVAELRVLWAAQVGLLAQKFESLQPEEWFEKHTAVSDEDFEKEPQRNKLNIIITRTSHLSYHIGQLVLLK